LNGWLPRSIFEQPASQLDKPMSDANKQRQKSTQNADGSLLKYVAAFAVIAVMALIAIVPFLITIINATGPIAR
jgi:hypothetical protein